MKKMLLIGSGLIVCMVLLIHLMSNQVKDQWKQEEDKYSSKIGTKFFLGKDTLLIVDYSILKETFTLSNGQIINFNLVK